MRPRLNLTNKIFGFLTVRRVVGVNAARAVIWECSCACGTVVHIVGSNLKRGTKSCGCLRASVHLKHGHTKRSKPFSSTYRTWQHMKTRCLNPNSPDYPDYGGRGITVCSEWLIFENFLRDMGEKPKQKSIDRIDNNQGYFKQNCRWATAKEQANNRRRRQRG